MTRLLAHLRTTGALDALGIVAKFSLVMALMLAPMCLIGSLL